MARNTELTKLKLTVSTQRALRSILGFSAAIVLATFAEHGLNLDELGRALADGYLFVLIGSGIIGADKYQRWQE